MGEGTKGGARSVGGKSTGAWVIEGRGGRRRAMDCGCDGKVLRGGAGDRRQQVFMFMRRHVVAPFDYC
jgi:hypothetical protein